MRSCASHFLCQVGCAHDVRLPQQVGPHLCYLYVSARRRLGVLVIGAIAISLSVAILRWNKNRGLMYVQFFCAFLGATACSAITTAIQTSAGLAGYPRRGLNRISPWNRIQLPEAYVTSIVADEGAVTIRPRRRCTYGRPAIPAAAIEPTLLPVSHQKAAP